MRLASFGVTIILLMAAGFSMGQGRSSQQELFGQQASERVPGAVMVLERPGEMFPSNVRLSPSSSVPSGEFVSYLKQSFNFGSEYAFEEIKSQENESGIGMKAYKLYCQGIPVENAVIIGHGRNGMIERYNGFAAHVEGVSNRAGVDKATALGAALESMGAVKFLWEVPSEESALRTMRKDVNATYYPAGELIFVKADEASSGYLLAWQFDVREAGHELDRRIFVDASTGEVIKYYPLVYDCDAGTVNTTWHGTQNFNTDYDGGDDVYYLLDDCGAASIHTILEAGSAEITNDDNDWDESNLTDYATTHYYARVTMDYYQAIHSRNSYDGADGDLLLRHVAGWANASYIGSGTLRVGMNTGNTGEFYNTLDVIAHEFTHAVTDNNGLGGLTYSGESGALNESFSDILGETTELWYENGAYTIDWLHREDYVGGQNRSFLNPNANSQPDTYGGSFWANTCGACPDNGGVHTNSGVMNYWWYLATVGGSGTNDNGDDYSVNGLGHTATRIIAYRMLTEEMTSGATFADARAAAIAITIDIYGDCSYELKQVTNAWYAAGVGNPYVDGTLESPLKPGGFNISCNGGSDGEIDLTPVGTAPFTYAWDDGPVTQDRSGLSAGNYGVTVTDATGCTAYLTITLTEPDLLTLSAAVTSDYNGYAVSCNGASDGVATATALGGAPPYSFLWDANADSQATAVASNLSAGTYDVSVTDANGCMAFAQVTLDEPPLLTIEAGDNQTVYYGYPPAACATLSYSGVGGGVPPYSFMWSTGETSQDIEVCPMVSTMYYVTVMDDNGCSATDSVIVCAIDVRCGNNLDKVEMCHYPPGNPENSHTICVGIASVEDHLAHGDMLAACGTDHSCTDLEPKAAPISEKPVEVSSELKAVPNPFSNYTMVSFATETDGQATLKIFDSYGRLILKAFEGSVSAFTIYEVEVSGRLLHPGIYYGVLEQSDGIRKVTKLVLRD